MGNEVHALKFPRFSQGQANKAESLFFLRRKSLACWIDETLFGFSISHRKAVFLKHSITSPKRIKNARRWAIPRD